MKRKILFSIVTIALFVFLALSVSAMEIKDDYVAENGDYEMHWVYGDSNFSTLETAPENIAKYEATYLSTDGSTKNGVFYAGTNMFRGLQVFNAIYMPSDFDLTQMIILPDVYVAEDGTTRNIAAYRGGGTQFYVYNEYAGELSFTGTKLKDTLVEMFTYSKYTTMFAKNTFCNFNSLETVTYNGKVAVEGTLFISNTVQSIDSNAFGASSNNTAHNFKVLYFEDRGTNKLAIQQWAFSRGIVEKLVFESGNYAIATFDTIGYFYLSEQDKTPTLNEIVICSGAKINQPTTHMSGSNYTIVFVGTEEQCEAEKSNFSKHTPTVFDVCYFTGHELSCDSIEYTNGYLNKGTSTMKCTHEGCTIDDKAEAPALFTCLGYSAPENGTGGIAIGFTVNNEAIAEYEEITGKTLKYGVFAVLQNRLGDKDVFAEDGTAAEGVISAEITNYQFVAFELKIVGFTDEQKDTKLAMGAYVAVTDGETTEYSYMQDDSKGTFNGKYYFASYNDIIGKQPANAEVTQ